MFVPPPGMEFSGAAKVRWKWSGLKPRVLLKELQNHLIKIKTSSSS